MSLIVRCLSVAAVPAMILAFGCSSTSSTPNPRAESPPPISETANSDVELGRPEVTETEVGNVLATLAPVYFDTDVARLQAEASEALKANAKSIVEHPEWGVLTIEGHCDERGGSEYNLALGQRRAAAVERYLVAMGVPASRLATRSFGASKPAVPGHDEGSWRFNRRSELKVETEKVAVSFRR